mmetsp:Transcript_10438/g.34388  ORF Transcript_10438/g.34388 Transcript_10438/m.34388 type:complete len:239 (-) Transcript_10438:182-898(-)
MRRERTCSSRVSMPGVMSMASSVGEPGSAAVAGIGSTCLANETTSSSLNSLPSLTSFRYLAIGSAAALCSSSSSSTMGGPPSASRSGTRKGEVCACDGLRCRPLISRLARGLAACGPLPHGGPRATASTLICEARTRMVDGGSTADVLSTPLAREPPHQARSCVCSGTLVQPSSAAICCTTFAEAMPQPSVIRCSPPAGSTAASPLGRRPTTSSTATTKMSPCRLPARARASASASNP